MELVDIENILLGDLEEHVVRADGILGAEIGLRLAFVNINASAAVCSMFHSWRTIIGVLFNVWVWVRIWANIKICVPTSVIVGVPIAIPVGVTEVDRTVEFVDE